MTLQTLLSIILSVLGLILLIYGLNKILAFGCMSGTEKEQAIGQIGDFSNFLISVPLGDMGNFILLVPKGWWLISFNATNTEIIPLGNVVCICNKEDCNDLHYCEKIQKPIFENGADIKVKIFVRDLFVFNKETNYELISSSQITSLSEEEIKKLSPLLLRKVERCKSTFEKNNINAYIILSSRQNNVPIELLKAIACIESEGNSEEVSAGCGAVGVMQLMPGIAHAYGLKTFENAEFYSCDKEATERLLQAVAGKSRAAKIAIDERFDPQKNVDAAAKHIKVLLNKYKSTELVVIAYNAGGSRADSCVGKDVIACGLPDETANYIPLALKLENAFKAA